VRAEASTAACAGTRQALEIGRCVLDASGVYVKQDVVNCGANVIPRALENLKSEKEDMR
jgi:hypothetical protein